MLKKLSSLVSPNILSDESDGCPIGTSDWGQIMPCCFRSACSSPDTAENLRLPLQLLDEVMHIEIYRYVRLILAGIGRRPGDMGDAMAVVYRRKADVPNPHLFGAYSPIACIAGLREQIERESDFETFFAQAPVVHPNGSLINGIVCGVRVEEIDDPLMQKIRYLDKLIDGARKGKDYRENSAAISRYAGARRRRPVKFHHFSSQLLAL